MKASNGSDDQMTFKALHRSLGEGVVVGVAERDGKNYVLVRYDANGQQFEYSEDIFTGGWGDYFSHSPAQASLMVREAIALKRRQVDSTAMHYGSDAFKARHKMSVTEAGKDYLGVRPPSQRRFDRTTWCWRCHQGLSSSADLECMTCGWILCGCSACGCGR